MENATGFNPNWASIPGDTIADILSHQNLSLTDFSKKMNSSLKDVKGLLHGFISIDEAIAKKLHQSIGGSVEYWIRREEIYRNRIKNLNESEGEKWLKELPLSDMQKYNWISEAGNKLEQCLNYFGIQDVWTWRNNYRDITSFASFKRSSNLLSKPGSLSVWVRQGEIQAEKIECKEWNAEQFRSALSQIKALSRQKSPVLFLPKLSRICAEAGVALAIAPTPEGCAASGVAKFLHPAKALILLSFRYKSDDQFWFTFFHEAGHLLLHGDTDIFIEEDSSSKNIAIREMEANEFALDILLPGNLKYELKDMMVTEKNIRALANKAGVSLGIIVGQLRFHNKIPHHYFSGLIRRYQWKDIESCF